MKNNHYSTLLIFIWLVTNLGCTPTTTNNALIDLPKPDFVVNKNRSDPNRPARKLKKKYKGVFIDTHVHLDPPHGEIKLPFLEELVEVLSEAEVSHSVFMPVPNEGHMKKRGGRDGVAHRKALKKVGGEKIILFCGSEYMTNWLHWAYRSSYSETELNEVLAKLNRDIANPLCSGIGEFGLNHFNKTGYQNIIQYPPSFPPFLKIMNTIAANKTILDFHAEPVDPFGKSYEDQVFGGLALIMQKNPGMNIIISHTGMTNPANVKNILTAYPSVMMNWKPIKKHSKWRNLEPITNSNRELYEDWAQLFEEMPDRFMVGSDYKFGREGTSNRKYIKEVKRLKKIIGTLSPEAAEMIAYKNAQRVFNLKQ